jgi:hypothetical protein
MKPVCVPCQRFFRPKRNGFPFIEGAPKDGLATPHGKAQPDGWGPYKLWNGDLWECPDCHAEIIVGVGWRPMAEHFQPDFAEQVTSLGAEFQVNDC